MGVEQRPGKIDQLRTQATYLGVRALTPVIDRGLENIANTKPVEFPVGFEEAYLEARMAGKVPIFFSNHTAQEDANSLAVLMDKIFYMEQTLPYNDRLKDVRLPLAHSLHSGAQGPVIQGIYHAEAGFLERHHVDPLHLVRAKDVNEDTPPNFEEYKTELMDSIRQGSGIIFFPEGDTTGGKRNAEGKINGMHQFQENAMRSLILLAKRAGKEPILIPVGIEGGFRFQVPETKRPSRWSLRVGFGFSDRTLVRIKAGMPIDPKQGPLGDLIKAKNWNGVDRVLEQEVAGLLPNNHRGIYREEIIFPRES
jgi:hypothetical protein